MLILAGYGHAVRDRASSALIRAKEYLDQKDFAKARREVYAAIRTNPSDEQTYLTAMSLYGRAKRYSEQAELGRHLIEHLKKSRKNQKLMREREAAIWSAIAYAHWQAGDYKAAELAYLEALAVAPHNASILNDLGYFYADIGIKPQRALLLTEKAAKLRPNDGNVVDSLGWALYRNKRYKRALEVLKRAVELEPNAAELRYHLGAVRLKLGQRAAARVELSKALILDPELTHARRLLSKA